jgi:hypothetical protein
MESHPLHARPSATREGIIAGLIGASAVAVWCLMLDSIAGRPFFTPAVLGAALFDLAGAGFGGRGLLTHVIAYTVVHVAAFVAVGLIAARAMATLDRRPSLWAGLLALFLVFELGFAAIMAVLSRSPLFGAIAWYQFGSANLLAAALMGRYLWRAHHPAFEERWLERTSEERHAGTAGPADVRRAG